MFNGYGQIPSNIGEVIKVLINGASGGVGTFAVQIAKAFQTEVTAVCSTRNVNIVRSLGADHVIDYTKEDFTKSEEKYDLILAVNGYHPISAYKRALLPNGTFVLIGGSEKQFFQFLILRPWISMSGDKKMNSFMQQPKQEDLVFLGELLESRKVIRVIERSYKLSEVPDALKYLDEGHAQGKIVINM